MIQIELYTWSNVDKLANMIFNLAKQPCHQIVGSLTENTLFSMKMDIMKQQQILLMVMETMEGESIMVEYIWLHGSGMSSPAPSCSLG